MTFFLPLVLAAAGRAETGTLPVPNGTLAYDTAGTGPAVVLIHGGLVDRRLWDAEMRWLPAHHWVIRYDVRGLGRSSDPTAPYSPVDDLDRLMHHLRIEKAVLIGLSLGGMIALDYALEHPERVEALVLCAPGLRGFTGNPREPLKEAYRALSAGKPEGVALLLDTGWGAVTPAARQKTKVMFQENLPRTFRADPQLVQWPAVPTIDRLPQIRQPALVLIGTEDEPDLLRIADLLAGKIPHAQKVVLPAAKHHLNLDQPTAFRRQVTDFLRRQPKK
jgi:pimeloyl-ACP methyl ester carboxylesterase